MKIGEIWTKSTEHFPIHRLKCEDLLPVYERISQLGYTELNVLNQLGIMDFGKTSFRKIPEYLSNNLKNNTDLDRMIKLFLLTLSIPIEEAEETFGKTVLDIMLDVNLLKKNDTGEVSAPVDLFPCKRYFLATDHYHADYCVPRHVYALMGDSYNLARSIISEPVESSLDLCTGSGVQAIVASGSSRRVVGVDINPRALNFSRFNALLNQVKNVEFRRGDLYEAVKGEKFDRVLSNPPFVPSPDNRIYFRDGGKTGEDILKKIIAGLKDHLNEHGICQIVTLLVFTDEDYNAKVASWVPEKNFNILSVQTPFIDLEEYVYRHFEKAHLTLDQYGVKINSWLNSYKEANIKRVAHGLINMKHTQASPKYDTKTVKHIVLRGCENEIKSWFEHMQDLEKDRVSDELNKSSFSLSPDIETIFTKRYTDGRFEYGVMFKAHAPYYQALISGKEKDLLGLLTETPISFDELMKNYNDSSLSTDKDNNKELQEIVINLMMNGIIEKRGLE
jgi:carbamoyltransferase